MSVLRVHCCSLHCPNSVLWHTGAVRLQGPLSHSFPAVTEVPSPVFSCMDYAVLIFRAWVSKGKSNFIGLALIYRFFGNTWGGLKNGWLQWQKNSTILFDFYFALMHCGVSHTPLNAGAGSFVGRSSGGPVIPQPSVSLVASAVLLYSAGYSPGNCAGVFYVCSAKSLVRGIFFWRTAGIKRWTGFCILTSWKLEIFCAVGGWCY